LPLTDIVKSCSDDVLWAIALALVLLAPFAFTAVYAHPPDCSTDCRSPVSQHDSRSIFTIALFGMAAAGIFFMVKFRGPQLKRSH
jgi:hypothetical protein